MARTNTIVERVEQLGDIDRANKKFWSKVNKDGECWEWRAYRYPLGYGGVDMSGRTMRANRVAWLLTYGDIPHGMCVLHKCNNKPCVRPEHLYLGTDHDNAIDRENSENSLKGQRNGSVIHPESRPRGERVNTVKLNEFQVLEIRNLYKFGEITQEMLAKKYGLSSPTIAAIIHGKSWKHIGGPVRGKWTKEEISANSRRAVNIQHARRRHALNA